ncbi:hypothetical protein ACFVTX_05145 [Agromyces sp. NPDC058136]|uniref:hypothetical protein n=1 Tax=Agromyces sp. NPDC058136 TaxID=3346354 RepID=UPI0036DD1601
MEPTRATSSTSGSARPPVVVLYDDRPDGLTGLKLAALSLRSTSPGLDVRAIVPGAGETFRAWASANGVTLVEPPRTLHATGWDVKPTVLLHLLDTGADPVLWFDTDIVATRDIRALLAPHAPEVLIAAEEYFWGYHQGSPARTTTLGLDVGRVLPRSLNSGVLRVSSVHRPLLEAWARVLASPAYTAAQDAPIPRRPIAYLGDQEVLGGLLGSRTHADVPLVQLRRGVDIAQCFGPSGFTVAERWAARDRLPALVHAMGRKPWNRPEAGRGGPGRRLATWWEQVHLDLTPYVEAARPHLDGLDEPIDWVGPLTRSGRLLARIGSPALRELPLVLVDTSQRGMRRALGIRQVPAEAAPSAARGQPR